MDDVTRIRAGLAAFCAGGASGASSAATDQLLVAARVLCEGDQGLERRFLDALPAGLPATAAGAGTGPAVRAPAAGWATARRDVRGRRRLALRLGHTTHTDPAALGAATVVAAMAATGLDDSDPVAAAEREAKAGPVVALAPVLAACAGEWAPPRAGITVDPAATAAAVVHVVRGGVESLDAALRAATAVDGETGTVAALVGAVVGPRFAGEALPSEVRMPDDATLTALARCLAARRARA